MFRGSGEEENKPQTMDINRNIEKNRGEKGEKGDT